eukprot:TRINITY_DN1_c0_g1_i1.p1 TRINITY_DN1_c0_g1~~TRINITY_DN1_c0_g1_i1.p1  ORF type:complete len:287 (-),score=58.86 TRINITY_DN1_c0_g1_i1:46-834(-)
MPRGPKKHLKRNNAPNHWMLDKMGGIFAPRPSAGPHKLRECLPLVIILRNRLKYALTRREVIQILMERNIFVDGKVRTDSKYPTGFQDVLSIPKTKENFRLMYDTKGRFTLHRITPEEAQYKLCKVKKVQLGPKGIPFLATHDGRTIRYPHPDIKVGDTIQYNFLENQIVNHVPMAVGNVVFVTSGNSLGRVGILKVIEKHDGANSVAYIEDKIGNEFTTLLKNVFVLGENTSPLVSLPYGDGVRKSIIQERDENLRKQKAH